MRQSSLSINDSLEVIVQQDGQRTSCKSSVYDIVNGLFQLHWPTRDGVRFPVHKDQELSLVYFREDAVYSLKGAIAAVQPTPIPTVLFQPTEAVERIQRREYCRVPASLPVVLVESVSQRAAGPGGPRGINIATRTIDISGSGMCIHLGFRVPPGTVFQVRLELEPDEPPLELTARAVYSASLPPVNGRSLYRLGMEFIAVSEPKRRQIVRQVFKLQQSSLSNSPATTCAEPRSQA